MKKIFFLSLSFILLSPFPAICAPSDYDGILQKAKTGKIAHQELRAAQKKCYNEYLIFFRKKYSACTSAQEKRNVFLNTFAKSDKKLAPMIVKFNNGIIRNAIDKKIFADVYKRFSADKNFMTIDRDLWEKKTQAAYASVSSQLSTNKNDPEKAYTEKLKEISDLLEANTIEQMAVQTPIAGKGSPVYKATLAEIEKYKKTAVPEEMVKARRNITLFCKYLFKAALKHDPPLEKLMQEAEMVSKQRIQRELLLELQNKDAAYARYTATFGLQQQVKGSSMQEIVLKDPVHASLVKKLSELNQKRQKLSRNFMKKTNIPAIRELADVITKLRAAGKK